MKNVLMQTEPVTVKRGAPVELVRWRLSAEGWTYDLVQGTYRNRNRNCITVEVGGQLRIFPRREWHVCAA